MFLLERKSLVPKPSSILDELYRKDASELSDKGGRMESSSPGPDAEADIQAQHGEEMVLSHNDCAPIANGLDVPELQQELERAINQVETALRKELEVERTLVTKRSEDIIKKEEE